MQPKLQKGQSRRELFKTVLRYAGLGTIAAAGSLAAKKRRTLRKEGRCINQGVCRGCKVFTECGLPQALSAKEVSEADNGLGR